MRDPLILAVGRFATSGHSKRQHEMVELFTRMSSEDPRGWRFSCVGNLPDTPHERAYFASVKKVANNAVDLEVNVDRAALDRLFERASIFWHASGLGVDELQEPHLVEHYGLSTAEAMAAGCVPVVINRGGQREIVKHGVNGFLWDTLEELRFFTELLMRDEQLRTRMSVAARKRARELSKAAFAANMVQQVNSLRR